jgi:hypothetical protein
MLLPPNLPDNKIWPGASHYLSANAKLTRPDPASPLDEERMLDGAANRLYYPTRFTRLIAYLDSATFFL